MRTITANFFMSLDGVVESPHEWHIRYFDESMMAVMTAGMQRQRAYLMGRGLYDEWSQYWPANADADPFGAYINSIPKYVLTHRPLDGEPWAGTTVLGDDAVAQVIAIKAEGEGEIGMSGCPTTVAWLIENGLLDELNLFVDPVLVGHGRRLFEGADQHSLELVSSAAGTKGALHLRYRTA